MALGDRLSLMQLALKCAVPGIPDFHQGAEGPLHHLTDPDNRLAVDWDALGEAGGPPAENERLAARKGRLTRDLLRRRADHPEAFAGAAGWSGGGRMGPGGGGARSAGG